MQHFPLKKLHLLSERAHLIDAEVNIKAEIYSSPEQTKGGRSNIVFVSDKLLNELQVCLKAVPSKSMTDSVFLLSRPTEWVTLLNRRVQALSHLTEPD